MRWLLAVVAIFLSATAVSANDKAPRPNIILFIADDLSWNDLGAYGHPSIHTPVLDRMAREGIRFDHAYLTASSCSPSRASILTGRYPHSTGAEQLHWDLPVHNVTFAEELRKVGYWTGGAGKWHMGEAIKSRFDLVREAYFGEGALSGMGDFLRLLDDRDRKKPFFLWLAAWDAHRPWDDEPKPYLHKREDVVVPNYYPATDLLVDDMRQYYDEVSRFDDMIGQVVAKLEQQGVANNTLIIVMADNGRPFVRDKATMYDGGMRTPFIAWWPKGIKKGVSQSIVSAVDIAPTFLELAGVKAGPTYQGRSFAALLANPELPFRDYAFSERNWHDFEEHGRTVRSDRYRYIRNDYTDVPPTPSADQVYHPTWAELGRLYDQGALTYQHSRPFLAPRPNEELYDYRSDPLEYNNLAGNPAYAKVLAEMREQMALWTRDTDDFIPSVRTPDDFDRRTGEKLPSRQRPRPDKKAIYGTYGKY